MNPMQLELSLSVVGPRDQLRSLTEWPMALRVTAGYAINPEGETAAHDLIHRSLPWNLWSGGLPKLVVVDDLGNRQTITVDAPQADTQAFLDELKAEVENKARSLWSYLDFKVGSGERREVVDDGKQSFRKLPWPGLLKSLTHLCPPTPSALSATWFFRVDSSALFHDDGNGRQLRADASLSAAPQAFEGGAASLLPDHGLSQAFDYGNGCVARCNRLMVQSAMAPGLDELDNYWLSIRDSRDDSLLDLAARLEDAFAPIALLSAVRMDEWEAECRIVTDTGHRRCTIPELTSALAAWRAKDHLVLFQKRPAELRKRVIEETLAEDGEPGSVMRERHRRCVVELLAAILDLPGTPKVDPDAIRRLADSASSRLLPAFFERTEPKPSRTGEGIQLLVGDDRLRLASENHTINPSLDEVAAIQFFGRRSTDPADLADDAAAPAPWHALSAGRYAFADRPEADGAVPRIFGTSAAYEDGVLYREVSYLGANLVCRNPLQAAHAQVLEGDGESGVDLLLASPDRVATSPWLQRALPLRYGDHYQFAASVLDRGGGQASELCEPKMPWKPRIDGLQTLNPPQRDDVHFLRRVAVGTCNVLPPAGGWPQTPDGVVLRCLEEAGPLPPGDRLTSVCLVPRANGFKLPPATSPAKWGNEITFQVEPPKVDEHTVLRWMMPPTNVHRDEQLKAQASLAEVMKGILGGRHEKLAGISANEDPDHVPDPAVTAIGVQWLADGQDEPQTIFLGAHAAEFKVTVGPVTGHVVGTHFTVKPGTWLRLSLHPLVEVQDFQRMDAHALAGVVTSHEWTQDTKTYRAFEGDLVLVECASDEVFQPRAELLSLAPNVSGDVDVRYAFSADAAQAHLLRHVDAMRLESRRWRWRNLPVPPHRSQLAAPGSDEWRRRLASGPPEELMDSAQRDVAPAVVDHFDRISAMDTGFVGREPLNDRFPRVQEDHTVLFTDGRDGIAAADYLRYTWALRSRYAGVLEKPERQTSDPRRIALPFRGDTSRIKPPRILAVIPLLQQVLPVPRPTGADDGTPFLVVLDEPWFREYGLGERLGAEIARVKREIGDTVDHPELRFGPLPDHSVTPKAFKDEVLRTPLDCFGPFGFSLDRTDDQAIANATGFVVYPPAGTPPHYNLFVKFQRLLDKPSGGGSPHASEFTDANPLYTLPDNRGLWPDTSSPLRLKASNLQPDRIFSYDKSTVRLHALEGGDSDLGKQYRYLLIVGRMGLDGGRALEVFLPANALWLHEGQATALAPRTDSKYTHGVIVEILLSGRHDIGSPRDPLGGAGSLRELFQMLLPGPNDADLAKRDALGMIRRFSPIARIELL